MNTKFKNDMEKSFFPLAKQINIHPNTISICSVIFTLAGAFLIISGFVYTGLSFIALGAFADFLDGTVAKAKKKVTKLGSLLDKFADRINDSLFILAPVFAGFVEVWLGILVLVLVLLGSYLSSLLDSHTTEKTPGNRLSMRAVRYTVMFIGGILTPFWLSAWQYSFYLILGIALYSLFERMLFAHKHLR